MPRSILFRARATRLVALVAAICGAAALAGCATSPPTRFYTVEPVLPVVVVLYPGPPLQVRAVHIPPAWDRIELLREVAPGQLQVREFDQWAAPLGRSLQQTLTQDLTARLPPGTVVFPRAVGGADAVELTVDILSLRIDGRLAAMQASWGVRSSAAPAWINHPLTLSTPTTGENGDATALALSRLLGQLADAIAAGLAPTGSTSQPAPSS